MHEWALAEAVVRSLEEIARGRKVKRFVVVLGVLQSIDEEIFRFALNTLLEDAKNRGVLDVETYEIIHEDPVARCLSCGYEWSIDMNSFDSDAREAIHFLPEAVHCFVKCPRCGSSDIEIVRGRGVRLEVVEYE